MGILYSWAMPRPKGGPGGGSLDTYTTTFPLTENPISESSAWVNGSVFSQGAATKTDVQTGSGNAYGTMVSFDGTNFIDSIAHLAQWSSSNHEVTGTFANSGAVNGLEAELFLRLSITPTHVFGYELDCVYSGSHVVLVRWDMTAASPNAFSSPPLADSAGSGVTTNFADGDQLYASVVGNIITAKYKAVGGSFQTLFTHDISGDSTSYSSGAPGIGFWNQTGSSANQPLLGWKDFTAVSL